MIIIGSAIIGIGLGLTGLLLNRDVSWVVGALCGAASGVFITVLVATMFSNWRF